MMRNIFKVLISIFILCCAGAFIAGGLFGYNAYREIKAGTCEIVQTIVPEKAKNGEGVPVGEPIPVSATVKTAFSFAQNLKCVFEFPEGLEAAEGVEQSCEISSGVLLHDLKFSMIPFREGEFANAKIKVIATRSGTAETKELSIELPKIVAVLPDISADEKLALAGTLEAQTQAEKSAWMFWGAGAVLLIIAGAIALILLRKKSNIPEKEIDSWIIAERELATLKNDVQAGKTGAMLAVAKISDIVRRYLAKRFAVKADAMTSQEFFKSMDRRDSPLAETHKRFMREFLTAADMVKFAGVAATNDLVFDAIGRAETLVKETVPTITEGQK